MPTSLTGLGISAQSSTPDRLRETVLDEKERRSMQQARCAAPGRGSTPASRATGLNQPRQTL